MQKIQNKNAFINVFLFPLCKTGLAHIILFTFFLTLLFIVRAVLHEAFGFLSLFILRGLYLINLLIGAEVFFYLISCVRESADGSIKAPDSLFSGGFCTGGFRDIIQDFLTAIAPYIFCFCPSLIYLAITEQTDGIYYSLLLFGICYFPMFFLAVVLFNSSSGFNPLTHIVSIAVTFIPYCLLVFQFTLLIAGFYCLGCLFGDSWISYLISIPCLLYFMMTLSNLLGRFYYLNQAKLNWNV